MAFGQPRPRFPASVESGLRRQLEDALGPAAATLDRPRSITKRALGQVHACEAHYLSEEQDPFPGWNSRNAEGTVVHRALELSIGARRPVDPLDLVDRAIDRLIADDRSTLGPWLAAADDLDIAELRSSAANKVTDFRECWPALAPAWAPRTETAITAPLCGGRVVLTGRVDLVLGVPAGDEARSLSIDLKTGRTHAGHLDDLRFYALVQTLRVGVPPFRVASYYLDSATFHTEDVTVETLDIALRRTIDGALRILELAEPGHPARRTAGPTCRWCRLRDGCPEAEPAFSD
jgi:hypothetical protein